MTAGRISAIQAAQLVPSLNCSCQKVRFEFRHITEAVALSHPLVSNGVACLSQFGNPRRDIGNAERVHRFSAGKLLALEVLQDSVAL